MNHANKIVWNEGLFVRPQHFQQQERYIAHLIWQQPNVLGQYRYGFNQFELNHHMLAQGKIALLEARGLFPDGGLFDTQYDGLPTPITLPDGVKQTQIYLGVITNQNDVIDVSFNKDNHAQHVAQTQQIANGVGNDNDVADIQVGKLALQLLSDEDDLSAFSCLPIAKVIEKRPDGKLIIDKHHIPPLLNIATDKKLNIFIEEVYGLLQQRGDTISQRLSRSQQAESAVVADFMLLQLINRYQSVFLHFLQRSELHPEPVFVEANKLIAELSTFTCDERRPNQYSIYDHNDLGKSFNPIIEQLRSSLNMVLEQHAVTIELTAQEHGIYIAQIHDKGLLEQSVLVLGVYADMTPELLRQTLPKQVKLGPSTLLRDLVSRGIPGIDLSPLPMAPRQIPQHANFSYFQVNQQHDLWQQVVKTGALALHIGTNLADLRLELWAIRT